MAFYPQIVQYMFPKNKDNFSIIINFKIFNVDEIFYLIHHSYFSFDSWPNNILYNI